MKAWISRSVPTLQLDQIHLRVASEITFSNRYQRIKRTIKRSGIVTIEARIYNLT
jgi:hypothetical protein